MVGCQEEDGGEDAMSWKAILKKDERWGDTSNPIFSSHDEAGNVRFDEYGKRKDVFRHRDHFNPEGMLDPKSRYGTEPPHKEETEEVWDEIVDELKAAYGDKVTMVSPKWNQRTNLWYRNLDILPRPNANPLYVKMEILTHDGPDKDGNPPTKENPPWPSTIFLRTTSKAKKINEVLDNAAKKLEGMNLKNSFGFDTEIDWR